MSNAGPETHLLPRPGGRDRVAEETSAVVVGGGIAGVAAATVLAERGVRVTLIEKERVLGGRAGAWEDRLADGTPFQMERGFHAFFRQYYNLRALLRRVDPDLSFLTPLEDYPIHGPAGDVLSFKDVPTSTPHNLLSLVRRSPAIGLGDLLRVKKGRALEMLNYDPERTYAEWDGTTAADYLDGLRFPETARRLFFDVFAHSFFNPEEDMSAAELLMMFHFYFTGNPEGLLFDVARTPFSTAVWGPFRAYLDRLGVEVRTGCAAEAVERSADDGWRVTTDGGAGVGGDYVVLALPVTALRSLVRASTDLDDPRWREAVDGLRVTHPFAVWRMWLDRPANPERAAFAGTTGLGPLDNISLFERFEDESRAWHTRHRGSVVELHAYAVDPDHDEAELRRALLYGLHRLYPEVRHAKILEERYLLRQDCPSFAPGSHAERPTVDTPVDGVVLAGDCVRLPIPSALMERATASGFLAANHLLARHGVRPEPIRSVPLRGSLARFFG